MGGAAGFAVCVDVAAAVVAAAMVLVGVGALAVVAGGAGDSALGVAPEVAAAVTAALVMAAVAVEFVFGVPASASLPPPSARTAPAATSRSAQAPTTAMTMVRIFFRCAGSTPGGAYGPLSSAKATGDDGAADGAGLVGNGSVPAASEGLPRLDDAGPRRARRELTLQSVPNSPILATSAPPGLSYVRAPMCGIAGLVNLRGERVEDAHLRRMIERVAHRGPDALGTQPLGRAGFAHSRLSIIDLSGGAQPMHNEDGTLWVTFNGEIFNFVELREELVAKGHVFATKSDTEVILHAYEEWGERCVERFNGQWAFAIWDTQKETLFLSRDRLGVRPLFYAHTPELFAFASEIKSIFVDPRVPRKIDLRGIDHVLTYWFALAPRTVFEGVKELPPGCSLLLSKSGEATVRPYFRLSYDIDHDRSDAQWADELRALLVDASRLRLLRADVPVGAYLSGGIDSTTITAIVHTMTEQPLKTFSVTFDRAEFDESSFQEQAVKYLGVRDHHAVLCTDDDIGREFPNVVWHAETPMIRTAPAPLYVLARLVRQQGYKVVLTGEGSDELLGGYDIYKEAKVRRFWAKHPESKLRPALLEKLYPYMTNLRSQSVEYKKAFFHVSPEVVESPFFSHVPRWDMTAKIKLFYSPDTKAALKDVALYEDVRAELPREFSSWDPFCQAQYLETRYLLPGYILSTQGDRMAMAHGVEGRFPFLDYRLAELAAKMPPSVKMKVLDEKHVLKRAVADLLPPFLKKRPKQPYRAQDVPAFFDVEAKRARFSWVEDLLSPAAIKDAGIFHPDAVRRLVEKAKSGGILGLRDGMSVVAILSAQLVHHQFIKSFGDRHVG
jgi:asparagine synthase (glutamine-hydrolysing)